MTKSFNDLLWWMKSAIPSSNLIFLLILHVHRQPFAFDSNENEQKNNNVIIQTLRPLTLLSHSLPHGQLYFCSYRIHTIDCYQMLPVKYCLPTHQLDSVWDVCQLVLFISFGCNKGAKEYYRLLEISFRFFVVILLRLSFSRTIYYIGLWRCGRDLIIDWFLWVQWNLELLSFWHSWLAVNV